jgi:glycosyltransferase involved in cell wall biosynthesis
LKKIFILIPAYNEEKNVKSFLSLLLNELKTEKNSSFKIVLIDDGSTDDTLKIVSKFKSVYIFSHKVNRGLGAAVRTGLKICENLGADYVVKIDADGQHDPKDIKKLLKPLIENTSDIVYGRRKLNFRTTVVRKIGNRFFSYLMKIITSWNVKDSQPGIFGINRDCLKMVRIFGDYNYTQQILLSAKLSGMRFTHVDVSFFKRRGGTSFVSLSYLYKALTQILVLFICFQPLRFFGILGIWLLGIGFLISLYQSFQWFLGNSDRVIDNVNLIIGLSIVGGQALLAGLLGQLIVNLNREKDITEEVEKIFLKKNKK